MENNKIKYLAGTRIRDLTGKKFGRLLVKEFNSFIYSKTSFGTKIAMFICECECGNIKIVSNGNLMQGLTKSCGCLRKEKRITKNGSGNSALNELFGRYKWAATKRKLVFCLSLEQFKSLTSSNCYYCGKIPSNIHKCHSKSLFHYTFNGIDRVDNNYGYVIENCVPCCASCNFVKKATPVFIMIKALQFLGYTVIKKDYYELQRIQY